MNNEWKKGYKQKDNKTLKNTMLKREKVSEIYWELGQHCIETHKRIYAKIINQSRFCFGTSAAEYREKNQKQNFIRGSDYLDLENEQK